MAGAGVALPDEPGGYYNPGAVALVSPHQKVQVRFYPKAWSLFPGTEISIKYEYVAGQIGVNYPLSERFYGKGSYFRAAAFGYLTHLNYGQNTIDLGGESRTFSDFDTATHLGLSIALISLVEVGVGGTAKRLNSRFVGFKASGNAYDFGMILRIPIIHVIERVSGDTIVIDQTFYPVAEGVVGMAWRNRGGNALDYGQVVGKVPFPVSRRDGLSVKVGVACALGSSRLELVGIRLAKEIPRPKIETTREPTGNAIGLEISIFEMVDLRKGKNSYQLRDGVNRHSDTQGVAVRSDGFFKLFFGSSTSSDNKWLALVKHLSIGYVQFEGAWQSNGQIEFGF